MVKQEDSGEGSLSLVLHHEKLNSGPLQHRIPAYLKFREDAVFLELGDHGDAAFQTTLKAEDKVVRALMDLGEATKRQIADASGLKVGTVNNHISKLNKAGRLSEIGSEGRSKIWKLVSVSLRPSEFTT